MQKTFPWEVVGEKRERKADKQMDRSNGGRFEEIGRQKIPKEREE